jgi:hypothetical protein
MDKVNGLTSVGQESNKLRQKDGRVATQRAAAKGYSLSPSAAPTGTYVKAAGPAQDNRTGLLINALSSISPALERAYAARKESLENTQMPNVPLWASQFAKDREIGAVDSAQVKEMFPEAVPTVVARIQQSTGEIHARRWAIEKVQRLLEDDSIRLNSEQRQAYLDQVRAEALELVAGKDFYGAGFIEQLDRSLNQFETTWLQETAKYHEDVQAEALANKAAEALKSGGDLLELDSQWNASSSLNHQQRNEVVVNAAIAQAMTDLDSRLLDRVPDRFLNAESKAKFEQAKRQIATTRHTQYTRSLQMQEQQRKEQLRQQKLEVIQRVASGEYVSPVEAYNNPDLYEFIVEVNNKPAINPTLSKAQAAQFESSVMEAATSGSFLDAFGDDPGFRFLFPDESAVTEDGLRDYILSRWDINQGDKVKLIEKLPDLMQGVDFLRDPAISAEYENGIGSDAKVFAQSLLGSQLMGMGFNIQGNTRTAFYTELRKGFTAYIEEHGQIPTGQARNEIIKAATEAATSRLSYIQSNFRSLSREQMEKTFGTKPTTTQPESDNDSNVVDWGELK